MTASRAASPRSAQIPQVRPGLRAVRRLEGRHENAPVRERQRTAACDFDAVLQRLRQVGEQTRHFHGRFQVLLGRITARPAGIVQALALVDADPRFVRLEFVAFEEAHVIGRDNRGRPFVDEREHRTHVFLVARPAGALHFEVIAVAEQREPAVEQRTRLRQPASQQGAADVAFRGAGKRNQSGRRFRIEPGAADQRTATVLALPVAARNEAGQVAKTRSTLGKQR